MVLTKADICIFCRKSHVAFRSVEHIIPESLGNLSGRHLLPKGIVCDPCNNYFSHSVEAPILSHISFQKYSREVSNTYQASKNTFCERVCNGHRRRSRHAVGQKIGKAGSHQR
ncbi:hypothetical protein CO657_22920 (plasmid) [Rhizobium acidisoli]|uniref:HNH endonuclease 5 domain-containing protein n=2 Tax=Rhizobium acidisoli TaxID=1538158 RepID=A0AAE5WRS3_9HYPH|nr:HNH endonuclease [Rhizobium acidisoli]QAS81262.1 hypothetical protein CO657_22920 [Rhizobium acidisoli]